MKMSEYCFVAYLIITCKAVMTRIIPARFESLIEMLKRNSSFPTEPHTISVVMCGMQLAPCDYMCIHFLTGQSCVERVQSML